MRFIGKGALALLSALMVVGVMAGTAFAGELWENVQVSPAPVNFTGKATNVKFTSATGEWVCSGTSTLVGQFFNAKEANVSINYKGCGGLGIKEEFSSTPLRGRIGYVNRESEVALRLEPVEGSIWAENFKPGTPLTNKIFGKLTPYETKTSKFTLSYEAKETQQGLRRFMFSSQPLEQLELNGQLLGVKATWEIKTEAEKPITIEHG